MQKKVIFKSILSFLLMILIVLCNFTSLELRPAYATEDYRTWRQYDTRWGTIHLGDSTDTMAKYGCAITALAMLCVRSGAATADKLNPGTVVNYCNSINGFSNGALMSWSFITGLVPTVKFVDSMYYDSGNVPTKEKVLADIKNANSKGYYMLCNVGGHFVLIDNIVNDNVYIADPGYDRELLFSDYDVSQFESLKFFTGPKLPTNNTVSTDVTTTVTTTNTSVTTSATTTLMIPTQAATVPQKAYSTGVYKSMSVINHRSGPSTSYSINETIPYGIKLNIIEISGNWGKTVYDGVTGWVCLDYTQYVSELPVQYMTGEYLVSSENGADLYDSQTSNANLIYNIKHNYVVNVNETSGVWGKVKMGSNSGWVNLEQLEYAGEDKACQKGDINADGSIDKYDLAALNLYLKSVNELPDGVSMLRKSELKAADINEDGVVDNNDVLSYLILICIG